MIRATTRLRVVSLLAALAASATATAQVPSAFTPIPGERAFSGRLVARPIQADDARERGIDLASVGRRAEQARRDLRAAGIDRHFPEVDEFLIRVPAGDTEANVAARLMATGNFSYVEPDWIVYPIGCPNDAQFSQQWHHAANRLASCAAWDIETGSPDVVVAICDTGVLATHQDLLLHRKEGYHVPTQRWESQGGPVDDINGHGTNCTGSAAGNGNNFVGIAGVGWNLGHRMMRVTDSTDGSASLSSLTLAARVAADRGDKVASVSYSGVNSSSVFTTGTYVRSKGALLVWAAGNSNVNLSGNREDSVIVVGATDQNDAKASFSNYGTLIDVFAPGVSIRTTSRGGTTAYASVSGTSFACPITAGLCALIWSRNPALSPGEVESILRASCRDIGAAGVDSTFGYGRIDAALALAMTPPDEPDVTPPAAPSGLAATARNERIDLSWSPSLEPDLAGYRVYRSLDGGATFAEITSGLVSGASYSDAGLQNGTEYHYVVRAEDSSGNLSAASGSVAATPDAPSGPVVVFADGFESGDLLSGGWITQNADAFAAAAASVEGGWGARMVKKSWMDRAISTAGLAEIQLSYVRRTAGLESNEALYVEWWTGSRWRVLESTRETGFASRSWALPAAAADNPAFRIRFRLQSNRTDEMADVDAVTLTGVPVG
jgi:subtilisin family serine protease